jgi:hypothetical protein
MLAEHEATILSRAEAMAEARRPMALGLAARRAAIWMAAVAALILAGLQQPSRTAPESVASKPFAPAASTTLALFETFDATDLARAGGDHGSAFFFGFLEFDWDPNAPGGVPGFGPLPKPPTPIASIQTAQ